MNPDPKFHHKALPAMAIAWRSFLPAVAASMPISTCAPIRLAGVSGSRGVKAGDRVVLFMIDSLEAVIAIVAVLKAGAIRARNIRMRPSRSLRTSSTTGRAAAIFTEARLGVVAARKPCGWVGRSAPGFRARWW